MISRLILALVLTFLLPIPAFAMQKYTSWTQDRTGNEVLNVTITVTDTASGSVASIYSDNGVTPKSNPFVSSTATFEFYAANGRYTIAYTKLGFTIAPSTDIVLHDPADAPPATTPYRLSTSTVAGLPTATLGRMVVLSDGAIVGASVIADGTTWVCNEAKTQKTYIVTCPEYNATGDGVTADAAAIQAAITAAAANGGGDVVFPPGTYSIATGLTQSAGVTLRGTGAPNHANGLTSIKPTAAVSAAITATNVKGVGLQSLTIDMTSMPVGSTGIKWEGVWRGWMFGVVVKNPQDNTSLCMHVTGSATQGAYYNDLFHIECAGTGTPDVGGGIKIGTTGRSTNAVTITGSRVVNQNVGWTFEATGSGVVCINCNSEGNASHGVEVNGTSSGAGTYVKWDGGEVSGNGGWAFTGDGRVKTGGVVMASNASGNINTTLARGLEEDGFTFKGENVATNRTFVGGAGAQTITASDTITATTLYSRLTAASAITMTSDPQIANGVAGQLLILIGTSNTNTVTIVDGQGVRLGGNCTLGLSDTLTMLYDASAGDWTQVGPCQNN